MPGLAGEIPHEQIRELVTEPTVARGIRIHAATGEHRLEECDHGDTARDLGIPLVASILDGTEPGAMAEILADPEQRATHVDAIADFAADGEFEGIDIDYEQFAFADGRDSWAATRPNWAAFI